MKKRNKKTLVSSFITTSILASTLAPLTNVKAAATVERMSGADRFVTAQNVAKQAFGKAENVVIVNGLGYADAVSAAPLAKILNAPILLVDTVEKPYISLLETLWNLGTKKIYIVGGQGVVTKGLEDSLAKSYAVERIAGNNEDGRYGTNAAVAKKVLESTKATEGILVSAEGYADALSVASIAASKGYPVLFGNRNEVPAVVKGAAQGLKVKAVGGEGVLPNKVLSQVGAERIAKGADRFATNLNVLDYFKNELKFDNIFVAAGGNDSKSKFADALVASAAAARYGAPLVLNGLGTDDGSKKAANKYIKDNMTNNNKITIVGGSASVDGFIENELRSRAQEINLQKTQTNVEQKDEANKDNNEQSKSIITEVNKVESIDTLSLNEIKINFAKEIDKSSAEKLECYQLNGSNLDQNNTFINASEDGKSIIITFRDFMKEGRNITVKVRNNFIKDKDTGNGIGEIERTFPIMDKKSPKVEKVEIKDDKKIYITFSEGVNSKNLFRLGNFKLDGETLNSEKANINQLGAIISVKNINYDNIDIVNGIVIETKAPLSKGQHTLLFPIDNDLKIMDTSNLLLDKDIYMFEIK